jgi:mannose-6-phosphate isomerase class I
MNDKNIYRLRPFADFKIWGGKRLAPLRNITLEKDKLLGETWEVSTLDSTTTSFLDEENRRLMDEIQLPFVVKYIDTTDHLSVQVHPNNQQAQILEGQATGKSECWLIWEASPGAQIFVGTKENVTFNDLEKELTKEKPDLQQYLQAFNVSPGDFFAVPAGTVHAIGAGVTLIEVQQAAGITYRFWDWNRLDKNGQSRELHQKKAFQCLNIEEKVIVRKILSEHINFYEIKDAFQLSYFVLAPGECRQWVWEKGSSAHVIRGSMICAEQEFFLLDSCIGLAKESVEIKAGSEGLALLFVSKN